MGVVQQEFSAKSARDVEAAAYFKSDEFRDECRKAIRQDIIASGESFARAWQLKIRGVKKRDMPYIEQAFTELKLEFPELNHVRRENTVFGGVILDTKPNTILRRVGYKLGCGGEF
jgi:hypothetical protein